MRSGDYTKVQAAAELEVSRHTLWRALSQEAANDPTDAMTVPARFLARGVGATVAALFVCSAACHDGSGASKAFIVDVAASAESCEDSRNIVAVAIGRHRARLNADPDVTFPEAVQRLREVMTYRAEKIVYVKAEPDVSWGEFLELVDDVWPEVNVVSILTPQVEARARRKYCLGPSTHSQ